MKTIIVSLFLLLLISCSMNGKPDLKNECCKECSAMANQDPSGYDISIKPCSAYQLTDNCAEYFKASPMSVGECSAVH